MAPAAAAIYGTDNDRWLGFIGDISNLGFAHGDDRTATGDTADVVECSGVIFDHCFAQVVRIDVGARPPKPRGAVFLHHVIEVVDRLNAVTGRHVAINDARLAGQVFFQIAPNEAGRTIGTPPC